MESTFTNAILKSIATRLSVVIWTREFCVVLGYTRHHMVFGRFSMYTKCEFPVTKRFSPIKWTAYSIHLDGSFSLFDYFPPILCLLFSLIKSIFSLESIVCPINDSKHAPIPPLNIAYAVYEIAFNGHNINSIVTVPIRLYFTKRQHRIRNEIWMNFLYTNKIIVDFMSVRQSDTFETVEY